MVVVKEVLVVKGGGIKDWWGTGVMRSGGGGV